MSEEGNPQCKSHKPVFVKNVILQNIRQTASGTRIKLSKRGVYKCSGCGRITQGRAKSDSDMLKEVGDEKTI
jgi:hypothetical protein